MVCHGPAYLSLEGSRAIHRVVGDRTAARGRFTVAGLCRTLTGFATTRRSTDVGRAASTTSGAMPDVGSWPRGRHRRPEITGSEGPMRTMPTSPSSAIVQPPERSIDHGGVTLVSSCRPGGRGSRGDRVHRLDDTPVRGPALGAGRVCRGGARRRPRARDLVSHRPGVAGRGADGSATGGRARTGTGVGRSRSTLSRSLPGRSAARPWSAPMTAPRTRLSLIDMARACAWALDQIGRRHPDRDARARPDDVFETRVDQETRADLGVAAGAGWLDAPGTGPATEARPTTGSGRRGSPTWSGATTARRWQCSRAARSRAASASSRWTVMACGVADPAMGDVVGLADGRVIAHGACAGFPVRCSRSTWRAAPR